MEFREVTAGGKFLKFLFLDFLKGMSFKDPTFESSTYHLTFQGST